MSDLPEVTAEMLTDLEGKAAAATPGPWALDEDQKAIPSPGGWGGDGEGASVCTAYVTHRQGSQEFATAIVMGGAQDEQGGAVGILRQEDAAFIAAANPAAVAALVREVRVAKRGLEVATKRDGVDCYGCQLLSADDESECPSDGTENMPAPEECQRVLVDKFMREARAALAAEEATK